MKSLVRLVGIIAIVAVMVFSMFSCDSGTGGGGTSGGSGGGDGSSGTSGTITANCIFKNLTAGLSDCLVNCSSGHFYDFYNYSNFDVKVTINSVTKTVSKLNNSGAGYNGYTKISNGTVTVSYSPANNVRAEKDTYDFINFYNK